jgi:hypothetical protein
VRDVGRNEDVRWLGTEAGRVRAGPVQPTTSAELGPTSHGSKPRCSIAGMDGALAMGRPVRV